jgi:hypothetical protein
MFKLNGKSLALDVAFTTGGINYPANWLRLTTLAEKNAIGITEVAGPAWYDQRFYWGVDNPKALADLKALWIENQKLTASSLLSKTDWMITRYSETTTAVPSSTTTYRSSVRTQCKDREDQITACDSTDELAALIGDGKMAGTAANGATEKFDTSKEKFDTSKEVKDGSGNSYDPKQYESFDPKQYESFDPKQYNEVVLASWPTE